MSAGERMIASFRVFRITSDTSKVALIQAEQFNHPEVKKLICSVPALSEKIESIVQEAGSTKPGNELVQPQRRVSLAASRDLFPVSIDINIDGLNENAISEVRKFILSNLENALSNTMFCVSIVFSFPHLN